MSTEQFRWIDDNPESDLCEYCSVCIVNDRIDIATQANPTTIGVVTGALDFDPSWATIQIAGRVQVYRSNFKPDNWILLRTDVQTGLHGPIDEYFIRA